MDELVEPFGVRFVPGTLVSPNENYLPDFIMARPTKAAGSLIYQYETMHKTRRVVTMPSAVGLEYTGGKGFDTTTLFVTNSNTWNETETTNFIDDTAKLNPAAGEVRKSYTTGLALSRKVGEKIQKVIILGDADCISNGEISINRNGVQASNFSVIMGAFYWMSDNEVPIDVRRPPLPDDAISLDKKSMATTRLILMWVFPGILALAALLLWIRRRGR
jgi:ABC-2 type transport system permease protein